MSIFDYRNYNGTYNAANINFKQAIANMDPTEALEMLWDEGYIHSTGVSQYETKSGFVAGMQNELQLRGEAFSWSKIRFYGLLSLLLNLPRQPNFSILTYSQNDAVNNILADIETNVWNVDNTKILTATTASNIIAKDRATHFSNPTEKTQIIPHWREVQYFVDPTLSYGNGGLYTGMLNWIGYAWNTPSDIGSGLYNNARSPAQLKANIESPTQGGNPPSGDIGIYWAVEYPYIFYNKVTISSDIDHPSGTFTLTVNTDNNPGGITTAPISGNLPPRATLADPNNVAGLGVKATPDPQMVVAMQDSLDALRVTDTSVPPCAVFWKSGTNTPDPGRTGIYEIYWFKDDVGGVWEGVGEASKASSETSSEVMSINTTSMTNGSGTISNTYVSTFDHHYYWDFLDNDGNLTKTNAGIYTVHPKQTNKASWLQNYLRPWLADFQSSGGSIDHLVVDYEKSQWNWKTFRDNRMFGGGTTVNGAQGAIYCYRALANQEYASGTSGWSTLVPEAAWNAFATGTNPDISSAAGYSADSTDDWSLQDFFFYASHVQQTNYLNTYINTIKEYYPNLTSSNWRGEFQTTAVPSRDGDSRTVYCMRGVGHPQGSMSTNVCYGYYAYNASSHDGIILNPVGWGIDLDQRTPYPTDESENLNYRPMAGRTLIKQASGNGLGNVTLTSYDADDVAGDDEIGGNAFFNYLATGDRILVGKASSHASFNAIYDSGFMSTDLSTSGFAITELGSPDASGDIITLSYIDSSNPSGIIDLGKYAGFYGPYVQALKEWNFFRGAVAVGKSNLLVYNQDQAAWWTGKEPTTNAHGHGNIRYDAMCHLELMGTKKHYFYYSFRDASGPIDSGNETSIHNYALDIKSALPFDDLTPTTLNDDYTTLYPPSGDHFVSSALTPTGVTIRVTWNPELTSTITQGVGHTQFDLSNGDSLLVPGTVRPSGTYDEFGRWLDVISTGTFNREVIQQLYEDRARIY
jgi:hypothetical protein